MQRTRSSPSCWSRSSRGRAQRQLGRGAGAGVRHVVALPAEHDPVPDRLHGDPHARRKWSAVVAAFVRRARSISAAYGIAVPADPAAARPPLRRDRRPERAGRAAGGRHGCSRSRWRRAQGTSRSCGCGAPAPRSVPVRHLLHAVARRAGGARRWRWSRPPDVGRRPAQAPSWRGARAVRRRATSPRSRRRPRATGSPTVDGGQWAQRHLEGRMAHGRGQAGERRGLGQLPRLLDPLPARARGRSSATSSSSTRRRSPTTPTCRCWPSWGSSASCCSCRSSGSRSGAR